MCEVMGQWFMSWETNEDMVVHCFKGFLADQAADTEEGHEVFAAFIGCGAIVATERALLEGYGHCFVGGASWEDSTVCFGEIVVVVFGTENDAAEEVFVYYEAYLE